MTEPDECTHRWRPSSSRFLRDQLLKLNAWLDYQYCPECNSFREKPKEE